MVLKPRLILIPIGAAGLLYMREVVAAILVLLAILYFSCRQTIEAYPDGGGSYAVAKNNLGKTPGIWAAGALRLDYILNVAVGISAGVGALESAVGDEPHRPEETSPARFYRLCESSAPATSSRSPRAQASRSPPIPDSISFVSNRRSGSRRVNGGTIPSGARACTPVRMLASSTHK
jgi:hypothetical protein